MPILEVSRSLPKGATVLYPQCNARGGRAGDESHTRNMVQPKSYQGHTINTMHRTLWPILVLSLSFASASGQSYGLLVGVRTDHLRAAGVNWAPSNGLVLGAFVPFHVGSRLVLRAEGVVSAERFAQSSERAGTSTTTVLSASAGLVGRYYVSRKFSCSTGIEYRRYLSDGPVIRGDNGDEVLRPNDLGLLLGVAYRFTDGFELGVRNFQGMMSAADLGGYGVAKHRTWSVMASFLLKYEPQPFVKRRKSRFPPLSVCRY